MLSAQGVRFQTHLEPLAVGIINRRLALIQQRGDVGFVALRVVG